MDTKKQRIGIFLGGRSAEKEVSLNSGRNIFNSMDRRAFEPIPLFVDSQSRIWKLPIQLIVQNTTKDIETRLGEAERVSYEQLKDLIDIAFPITFGSYGEDGCLQGLLSLLGIPFVGSPVLAAALGQDKVMQRLLLSQEKNINVPPYIVLSRSDLGDATNSTKHRDDSIARFGLPLVAKPARGGSTIGVSMIESANDWTTAIEEALKYDTQVVIEPWLDGLEFSCVVMEDTSGVRALTPTETVHADRVFTYNEKYMPGASNKITPARVSPEQLTAIQAMCVATFTTLGFRGYARIDGFVLQKEVKNYPTGTILITDPNVFSGMAPSSWTFHQAAQEGWDPRMWITKLIETVTFK